MWLEALIFKYHTKSVDEVLVSIYADATGDEEPLLCPLPLEREGCGEPRHVFVRELSSHVS